MNTIEWKNEFETGNSEIDTQHRIFVRIVDKLVTTKNNNGDEHLLESLLAELLKFAEFHFCSEENLMREHGYPDFIHHRKEHERALAELRNRIFSLKYEYIDFVNLESYLINWFSQHTITEDLKLAAYLKKKKQ